MSTNPTIYSDSLDNVYIYDYGHTVEIVNWGCDGRKLFYSKQGIEGEWNIIECKEDIITVTPTDEGPPWDFPPCPTLNPNLTWIK